MIKFSIWMLPWAAMMLGALLVFSGVTVICDVPEDVAAQTAITGLENSNDIANEWLQVTEGFLYWPECVSHYKKSNGGESGTSRKTIGHFVPIVSRELAERWTQLGEDVKRPDVANLTFVWFKPGDFVKLFPDVARNELKGAIQPFEVVGLRQNSISWPKLFRDHVTSSLAMPKDNVIVLKFGEKPVQRGEAAVIATLGFCFAGGGVFWIRRRRSWSQARKKVIGGTSAGIEAAIRGAVSKGVGQSFSSANPQQGT